VFRGRSRSQSNKRGKLVNPIDPDPDPLNGFEPVLTQIVTTLSGQRDYVLKVMGSKVKVMQ